MTDATKHPDAREVATQVAGQAKDLVLNEADQQRKSAVNDLGIVAKALRDTSQQLENNLASTYAEKAADQVEQASKYLRTANLKDVVGSVESFARREPLLFLGGAFALGILGARFLKSSASTAREEPTQTETTKKADPGDTEKS